MPIRYIFSDSDDTIARHPRHGDRTTVHAEEGGRILMRYPNVGFSVVTGQPYEATRDVVEALGVRGPHVYEMGWCWARLGEEPSIMPHINGYEEVNAVRILKERLTDVDVYSFAKTRGVEADLIRDKKHMLSFAMSNGSTGQDFIDRVLTGLLKEYGPEVAGCIPERARVINPGFAIDVLPNCVGKKRTGMKLASLTDIGHGETLALVDSGIEDVELLDMAGYAACPADSSHEIKEKINSRRKGRGYISPKTCAQGAFPDMLEYAQRTWGFAA